MRILVPALAVLLLAACTGGPTIYTPAAGGNRGYAETRIEADRYRVEFRAGADVSFETAEAFALRRAAELTLEDGGDWFIVTGRSHSGNERNPVGIGGSVGHSVGSRGYSASGVGVGLRFDGSAGNKSVALEFLIRSGPRETHPDAYDARDVLAYSPQ